MSQVMRARMRALVCGVLTARKGAWSDSGMVTSEYAMGIVAAVGFAIVLHQVVTSGAVTAELQDLVERALHARV
ncbi:DUF4244 domain-containing protein [Streptomyces sp. NPDC005925]|uniref:DUF4244 domain-containing protein n=1 Tax=Streptomyces sp. NPDC005925 TaxID=3157172 RepID=UPI0033E22FDC